MYSRTMDIYNIVYIAQIIGRKMTYICDFHTNNAISYMDNRDNNSPMG